MNLNQLFTRVLSLAMSQIRSFSLVKLYVARHIVILQDYKSESYIQTRIQRSKDLYS